jgi:thiol-disulfide isomerase/thioredoxin
MFIAWLTPIYRDKLCIPAVLLPHSPCRFTTANAPANRQMPIASVFMAPIKKNASKKTFEFIIMKQYKLILLCLTLSFTGLFSQSVQNLNKKGLTEVILSQKHRGFIGDETFSSTMSVDQFSSTFQAGFPTFINLPDSLKRLKLYCYSLNYNQSIFNNYRRGVYNREFFLKNNVNNWISDTIQMTDKKVRNFIAFAVGYDTNNKAVYVADANANNDFSDDKLLSVKKLNPSLNRIENATNIGYEYFDGKYIKQDNTLFLVCQMPRGNDIWFTFPEYHFTRISYRGKKYIISTYPDKNEFYVYPDSLFSKEFRITDYIVKPSQYVKLGDSYFKCITDFQNSYKIKLVKVDIDSKTYSKQFDKSVSNSVIEKTIPASEKTGMPAPEISGINILDSSIISLNKCKGKYVFLDFWGTFCGPCIAEFPTIRKLYDLRDKEKLEFIGVSINNNGEMLRFLKSHEINWPNILKNDSETKTTEYKISSVPTNFLIDPSGYIIKMNLRDDQLTNSLIELNLLKNNVP